MRAYSRLWGLLRLYARSGAVDGGWWRWWVVVAVPFHLPVRAYSRNRGGLRLYARSGMAGGDVTLGVAGDGGRGGGERLVKWGITMRHAVVDGGVDFPYINHSLRFTPRPLKSEDAPIV